MDWNPSAPDKIGLQWAVRNREGQQPFKSVDSFAAGALQRMASTDAQSITHARVPMLAPSNISPLALEFLTSGAEVPGAVSTTILRPNNGAQSSGTYWQDQSGSTSGTNLRDAVDNAALSTGTYIRNATKTPGGLTPRAEFEFPTAGLFTGQRIVGWRVKVAAMETPGLGGFGANLFYVYQGTAGAWFGAGLFPLGVPAVVAFDAGELQSVNNRFTTIADMQAMDTSSFRIGIGLFYPWSVAAYNAEFRIFQVWLEVDTVDENRQALYLEDDVDSAAVTWTSVVTANASNASTPWTKTTTDLAALVRTARLGNQQKDFGGGLNIYSRQVAVPLLQGFGALPASTGLVYYPDVLLNADGTVAELGDPSDDTTFGVHFTPSTTDTVDHQDYARVVEVPVSATSGVIQQEVSGASVQAYHGVRFPVIMDDSLGDPGTLTVRLRRRSDNVVVATATVTAADYAAATVEPVLGEWRMVQAVFAAPPTLAAATQYAVDWTADGAGRWLLQLLTAYVPLPTGAVATQDGTTYGQGTYGGTTNVATVEGTDQQYADFPAVVYVQPATVEDLTANPAVVASTFTPELCVVRLEWTAWVGSLGYYEVQRSDPYTDWQTVARITDQAVVEFVDHEGRRGIESTYRIRAVDSDGYSSDWSDEASAQRCAGECGLTFTTNEAPEMGVAYEDVYPRSGTPVRRSFDFPEADEATRVAIADRDYFVVFQPLERRGVRFSRLLKASAQPGDLLGPRVFDRLRDLAKAALSYVCVCDEQGNRWFARIGVPSGDTIVRADIYLADVTVEEVTNLPSSPDVRSTP